MFSGHLFDHYCISKKNRSGYVYGRISLTVKCQIYNCENQVLNPNIESDDFFPAKNVGDFGKGLI